VLLVGHPGQPALQVWPVEVVEARVGAVEQVLVSRSTADWARSGSAIMASHSFGSRLDVTMVADL
jgi:hypothetical protein